MTYRELNRRANRLARYLRELGVGPEKLVGVMLDRSVDMVVSLSWRCSRRAARICHWIRPIRKRAWNSC